jgi:ABC-type branched-subunit amino acid transport system ATPase component
VRRTFQTEQAIEELSIYDNVRWCTSTRSKERARRREDVLSAIEFVGLTASRRPRSASLGAGERRLVEIARARRRHAAVILLDEPAAGLPDEET